jgi:hypothetical protein
VQEFTRIRSLFAAGWAADSPEAEVAPEPKLSAAQPWSYHSSLQAEGSRARRINPAVAAIVALSVVVLVQAIFLFRARTAQPGPSGSDSPRSSAILLLKGEGTKPPAATQQTAPQTTARRGWLRVETPIDVQIFEDGELIGSNETSRVAFSAGHHLIDVVSRPVGYRNTFLITIVEGRVGKISLELPMTTIDINAVPWADVSLDGKSLGPTPLSKVPVTIGPHELLFTHPRLGERREKVQASIKGPNRVGVNLAQN